MTDRRLAAALAGWLLAAGAAAREPAIEYRKARRFEARQNLALTKSANKVTAADLRPLSSRSENRFHYRYALTRGTPIVDFPLALDYRDDRAPGTLGVGWRLVLPADFDRRIDLDLTAPRIGLHSTAGSPVLILGGAMIDARPAETTGGYLAGPDRRGWRWRFEARSGRESGETSVVPVEIRRPDGAGVRLRYTFEGRSGPRLEKIEIGDSVLSLRYAGAVPGPAPVDRIELVSPSSETVWELIYDTFEPARQEYLRSIRVSGAAVGVSELRFSYRAFDVARPPVESREAAGDGIWRRVANDRRFVLPRPLRIDTRPGLRLMYLGPDTRFELVEAGERSRRSWSWSEAEGWRSYTSVFEPHRPLVGPRLPRGTVFSDLHMKFAGDSHRNTEGFPSMIVSYYRPTADQRTLTYTRYTCFPRVRNQALKPGPGGEQWQCVDDPRLALPVPLQYEGDLPWPRPRPGLHAVERARNQGAQFLDLGGDGKQALYYVGLLYRDAETGADLFAGHRHHRDTGNCAFRYRTPWDPRQVAVYLCQGLWLAREAFWPDNYSELHGDLPFWERKDLSGGVPNGLYVLPFEDDPAFLAHYEGFGSVQFARLSEDPDYRLYAVVAGRGKSGQGAELDRPPARRIYRLRRGLWRWERLPADSELFPPAAFFEDYKGRFVDLNNDELDDAVVAVGRDRRRTYLNTGSTPRWLESPAHRLPRECDLTDGRCLLFDLDQDTDLDLFVGSGKLVFINESEDARRAERRRMTFFTDEEGRYRSVSSL